MKARELAHNVCHVVRLDDRGKEDSSFDNIDLPWPCTGQDQVGSCPHRVAHKVEAALARHLDHTVDHGGEVVHAKLMKCEPPELSVLVRVKSGVLSAVLRPPEVAEPDVVAKVGEKKPKAVRA